MNIEKTISEHAVSDILTPMLESQDRIVTEDVAPLFEQATGLDTPPASGSVTTTIEESRSVISAIIRKAWTAPLTMLGGASVLSSIAAAYTYLRNRLQGNETYGIPDRRSEISASSPLAANLALLNDRKIGGVPEAEDGMSLVQLISSSAAYNTITELTDTTTGWLMNKGFTWSLFPNLLKIAFGCKKITAWSAAPTTLTQLDMNEVEQLAVNGTNIYYNNPNLTEIVVPKLYEMDNGFTYDDPASGCFISKCDNLRKVRIESLEKYGEVDGVSFSNGGAYCCLIHSCANLEEVEIPTYTGYKNWRIIRNCPKVWKVVLGDITSGVPSLYGSTAYPFDSLVNLYHLEIAGCTVSLDLRSWNPTTALSDNLQQFLSNFKTYIAERLADNGSGKTLTISQAVFSAVIEGASPICDDIKGIIEDKGWKVQDTNNNIFPTT